jgi:hypothetical protein
MCFTDEQVKTRRAGFSAVGFLTRPDAGRLAIACGPDPKDFCLV